MGNTFEYHIETIPSRPLYEMRSALNNLGKKGWELVSIDGDNFYFKKRNEDTNNTSEG